RDCAGRQFIHALGARQRIAPGNVHRTRTADAFATGTTKSERGIHRVLDGDDGVEHHRAAGREIELVGIPTWIFAGLGIVAVNLELAHLLGAGGGPVTAAGADLRILRQRQLDHGNSDSGAETDDARPSRQGDGMASINSSRLPNGSWASKR